MTFGGLGLVDCRLIAPSAYFASAFAVREFVGASCGAIALINETQWYGELQSSITQAEFANGGQGALTKGLQRVLSKKVLKLHATAIIDALLARPAVTLQDKEDKARLLSIQDSTSAAWLRAIPVEGDGPPPFTMSKLEFITAMELRLGLQLTCQPTTLQCSFCYVPIGQRGAHRIPCSQGAHKTHAHDAITKQLSCCLSAAGLSHTIEPIGCFAVIPAEPGDLNKKPDLLVRHDPRIPSATISDSVFDVCITNPTGVTNIDRNRSTRVIGELLTRA